MRAKKKLIARMALWAAGVFALAAVVGLTALLLETQRRRQHVEGRDAAERQRVEESRAYLAGLAKRIDRLPLDGTLASEIESRYFEELPRGAQYVWAMDQGGGFSFGVPRPAFDALNALYDREVAPRLTEGVFVDRLSFLLTYIDDHGDLSMRTTGDDADLVERGRRWRMVRPEPTGAIVVSVPLKTAAGGALGSLYLKRTPSREGYHDDDRLKAAVAGAGIAAFLSFAFLWVLLPAWVYVDARERGVRRAPLFAFLTVLSSLIGLLVYLIARPEERGRLTCPGCAREIADATFCPHCGRDLSRSFCPACRYPLQPEWAYCPACRTEVRAQPGLTPAPEAG